MLFLAGTAASGAIDLMASLRKALDSGNSKGGDNDASFGLASSQTSSSSTDTSTSTAPSQPVSSGTMRLMLSLQAHGVDMSSKIFGALDSDGSGGVSKSEFEQMFAKNGDTSRADTAFDKLDTDHDGSVSSTELASGLKTEGHHHGGHGGVAKSDGQNDSGDGSGSATTKTVTNVDGSTTTTISYADGSAVSMTQPAASASSTDKYAGNLLERLIQRQANMLTTSSAGQSMAVSA
jgi:Ca2+-binding EF-hand superfamily protein